MHCGRLWQASISLASIPCCRIGIQYTYKVSRRVGYPAAIPITSLGSMSCGDVSYIVPGG
jgi:hypothetical protein